MPLGIPGTRSNSRSLSSCGRDLRVLPQRATDSGSGIGEGGFGSGAGLMRGDRYAGNPSPSVWRARHPAARRPAADADVDHGVSESKAVQVRDNLTPSLGGCQLAILSSRRAVAKPPSHRPTSRALVSTRIRVERTTMAPEASSRRRRDRSSWTAKGGKPPTFR
jgi:hypothetical protein